MYHLGKIICEFAVVSKIVRWSVTLLHWAVQLPSVLLRWTSGTHYGMCAVENFAAVTLTLDNRLMFQNSTDMEDTTKCVHYGEWR